MDQEKLVAAELEKRRISAKELEKVLKSLLEGPKKFRIFRGQEEPMPRNM